MRNLRVFSLLLSVSAIYCEIDFLDDRCVSDCAEKAERPCSITQHEAGFTGDDCPFFLQDPEGPLAALNFTDTINYEYESSISYCSPRISLWWEYPPSDKIKGFHLTVANVNSEDNDCVFFNISMSNQSQEWSYDCFKPTLNGVYEFILASQPPRQDNKHEVRIRIDTRGKFFNRQEPSLECIPPLETTTAEGDMSTEQPKPPIDPMSSSSTPTSTDMTPEQSITPTQQESGVTDKQGPEGPDTGAIVGIVLAVMVFVIAVVVLILVIFLCKCCRLKSADKGSQPDHASYHPDNSSYQDINVFTIPVPADEYPPGQNFNPPKPIDMMSNGCPSEYFQDVNVHSMSTDSGVSIQTPFEESETKYSV